MKLLVLNNSLNETSIYFYVKLNSVALRFVDITFERSTHKILRNVSLQFNFVSEDKTKIIISL